MKERKLFEYNNKIPFLDWFETLTNRKQNIINDAIKDVCMGKTGKVKNLKGGLYEIRLHTEGGFKSIFY